MFESGDPQMVTRISVGEIKFKIYSLINDQESNILKFLEYCISRLYIIIIINLTRLEKAAHEKLGELVVLAFVQLAAAEWAHKDHCGGWSI